MSRSAVRRPIRRPEMTRGAAWLRTGVKLSDTGINGSGQIIDMNPYRRNINLMGPYRKAPRTLTSTCSDPFECPQFA